MRLRNGINGVTQALAAKQYPLGITIDNHHTVIANAKGGNVKWFYFEPVLGLSNNIGLVKGGPHPNAGKLLIDYILSVGRPDRAQSRATTSLRARRSSLKCAT